MDVERTILVVAAFLATYAGQSTIVLLSAYLVTARLHARFDGLAESILRAALLLSVTAPILTLLMPMHGDGPGVSIRADFLDAESAITRSGIELSWPMLAVAIWMLGAMLGVVHLALARGRLKSLTRDRQSLDRRELRRLTGDDVGGRIAVTSSRRLGVPIAFGKEICIPRWALTELSAPQLRLVVAHEAAHLRRHDEVWGWVRAIICRSFFFQPLNWIVSARLRELAECICDDEAIRDVDAPAELATALGIFAARITGGAWSGTIAPAIVSGESLTLRRVRRILGGENRAFRNVGPRRGLVLLLTGTGLLAVMGFAPRVHAPSPPQISYTIHAQDPAGEFTLTMDRGRVVAATISGKRVPESRLRQKGRRLELIDERARRLSVKLTASGGIRWSARPTTTQSLF